MDEVPQLMILPWAPISISRYLVIGKEIRPVKVKEDDKINEADIEDWDMRERMAMTVIYLNIKTGLKFIIEMLIHLLRHGRH